VLQSFLQTELRPEADHWVLEMTEAAALVQERIRLDAKDREQGDNAQAEWPAANKHKLQNPK
jgi:hypothetical protein